LIHFTEQKDLKYMHARDLIQILMEREGEVQSFVTEECKGEEGT